MQCNVAELDSATGLAQGSYSPPIVDVLHDLGEAVMAEALVPANAENLFDPTPHINAALDNMVLAFPGNPLLTVQSQTAVPAKSSSNTLQQDAVMNGQVPLFSGFTELKITCYILLPALVVLHCITVLFFCYQKRTDDVGTCMQIVHYYSSSISEMLVAHGEHDIKHDLLRRLNDLLATSLACGLLGCGLIILFGLTGSVYGSSACIDPFILITLASPEASAILCWSWVVLVLLLFVGLAWHLVGHHEAHKRRKARSERVLAVLALLAESPTSSVLRSWHANKHTDVWRSCCRRALLRIAFYFAHILPLAVVAFPEVCKLPMHH